MFMFSYNSITLYIAGLPNSHDFKECDMNGCLKNIPFSMSFGCLVKRGFLSGTVLNEVCCDVVGHRKSFLEPTHCQRALSSTFPFVLMFSSLMTSEPLEKEKQSSWGINKSSLYCYHCNNQLYLHRHNQIKNIFCLIIYLIKRP